MRFDAGRTVAWRRYRPQLDLLLDWVPCLACPVNLADISVGTATGGRSTGLLPLSAKKGLATIGGKTTTSCYAAFEDLAHRSRREIYMILGL